MNAALTEARGVLAGPQTALAVILQSMSIIVREGLEAVLVLAVSYPLLVLGRRLPLKPFFKVTGVLLLLLAFKLTGGGLRELQEAGVLPYY